MDESEEDVAGLIEMLFQPDFRFRQQIRISRAIALHEYTGRLVDDEEVIVYV